MASTMISTQTISMCSPRLPPLGTRIMSPVSLPPLRSQARRGLGLSSSGLFPKGCDRYSTGAIKQGGPSFSSPGEDAPNDDEVPAMDTHRVPNFTGMKTIELLDPISPTKLLDDHVPPLQSLVIHGFPPFKISKYVDEAENCLHQDSKRYQNVRSLDSYYYLGLCGAAYAHPNIISRDRLVAIAINYGLLFLLDDLFFDTPSEILQDKYGISSDARESPPKMQECLNHLDAVFSQQVPHNPTSLIETMMWEAGQHTLELTNPEWFDYYVTCVKEHHHACLASHIDIVQGHNLYLRDVESYLAMRIGNVGGKFIQLMVELANNSYIPNTLRTTPYLERLTTATSIHLGIVNDVFSYHKESSLEQNPCNLITVLMECEGKPLVQTLHKAIDVVNTYARAVMDLEGEAWSSTLRIHMQGIKELIAGNVYFSFMDCRYRHVDSIFPELRDTTSSWKILPHAKG